MIREFKPLQIPVTDWIPRGGMGVSELIPQNEQHSKMGKGEVPRKLREQQKAADFVWPQHWSDQNGKRNNVAHPKLAKYFQSNRFELASTPNIPSCQLRMPSILWVKMLRQVKGITLVLWLIHLLIDLNGQIYCNCCIFLSIIYICIVFSIGFVPPLC